ncbi:hypothetical protein AB1Y20_004143 [Prymnesium parvum]|uniref:Uncharacterized protein n=1 Tax=Prymnesium parvum TaxID=97485 RepID=A0AB34J944_PRYPA
MLRGRVVCVTGAAGGIGRAAVLRCVAEGASVLAADSNLEGARETAAQAGGGTEACAVDVSDEASVEAMVRLCAARFGRLDCALNAAGVEGERAELHQLDAAHFDAVMRVNARGTFLCLRAQIGQMLRQASPDGGGAEAAGDARRRGAPVDALNYSIVNLASTAAHAAMAEFAASKHAVVGLTRTAAREYASRGVRVNAICPSTTDTPMVQRFAERWPEWQAKQNASFPVGRIGTPEEVAGTVVFLFSSACPMMTGTCLTIDGALTS